MEILNKNHRKKALLRLGAMGILVLCLTLTAVFAFHQAYANQGQTEISKLEKELENTRAKCVVETNALQNQMNRMKQQHKEELARLDSDPLVDKLKEEIEDLKEEKRDLKEDLQLQKSLFERYKMRN